MKKLILLSLFVPLLAFGQYQSYYAIGDSLTAAFSSYSLVESVQKNSYPALIARQMGISVFEQPLVSEPGIPTKLVLSRLNPVTIAPMADAQGVPLPPGVPLNLDYPHPYNNLGVVGAILDDCLNTTSDPQGRHDLVLRGMGTQVQQAILSQPDLLTVWIGANDALTAVLYGTAIQGVTLSSKIYFQQEYDQLLDILGAGTHADIVVANVPPVTSNPFVNTIPPYIINPATGQPVIGPDGLPMTYMGQSDTGSAFIDPHAYVTLNALPYIEQGYGIPVALGGKGVGLPDSVVLTPNETAMIEDYVDSYNASIAASAQSHHVALFDAHAFISSLYANGLDLAGIHLGPAFLTGGLFSYDGFHPTSIGYAVIANAFINVINEAYGHHIKPVGLAPFLAQTAPDLGSASCCGDLTLSGWEMGQSWLCSGGREGWRLRYSPLLIP